MAGKFENKKVYVETDFNNIILVDPNKLDDPFYPDGKPRLVDHEDLVMYANLETKIIPRTKLAVGQSFDVVNTSIASFANGDEDLNLNFLRPKGKNAFDTSWTDEFTGKDTRKGGGVNQKIEYSETTNGTKKIRSRIDKYEDTQTLGIKSINVKITPAGTPTVDIKMVDVGGRALFQQGDNSIYSVFFNLPYPAFYLTLKGYYGKAARFQLVLTQFTASFEPRDGNFSISLKLTGKLNALLFDTTLGNLRYTPKMYPTTYSISKRDSLGNVTKVDVTTTMGLQKLKEVYTEYNSRSLIGTDLWNLVKDSPMTLEGLEKKLENFTENLNKKLASTEFSIVNDINDYRENLKNMDQVVYTDMLSKYLDKSKIFVINGLIHIPYKSFISKADRSTIKNNVLSALQGYLETKLKSNEAFGEGGTKKVTDKDNNVYELGGPIKIGNTEWNANNMMKIIYKEESISSYFNDRTNFWEKTYFAREGKLPSNDELDKFIRDNTATGLLGIYEYDPTTNTYKEEPVPFYVYGEQEKLGNKNIKPGSYIDIIQNANSELDTKEANAEDVLAKILEDWTAKSTDGLGFSPTIRNLFAVIMANAETYYRMMDDVHERAWKQRYNPQRLKVILENKTPNVEPHTTNIGTLDKRNFVYPWPQYYEKETQKDGRELYVIKYIGDTDSKDFESGANYETWPEVDFTEEYLARTAEKEKTTTPPLNATNNGTVIKFVSPNAIEFPYETQPFGSLATSSFLYELWERSYLNSNYSNFARIGVKDYSIDQLYGEFEGENAKIAAEGDLILPELLKNNVTTYEELLTQMYDSSKVNKWGLFRNDIYVTDYIKNYFIDTTEIYSVDQLTNTTKSIDYANKLTENIDKFLKDTKTNDTNFLTIFPFNNLNWLKTNLANGNSIGSVRDANQTTNSFVYDQNKKIISRLTTNNGFENKLIVSNTYLQPNNTGILVDASINPPIVATTRDAVKDFYLNRKTSNLYSTETLYNLGTSYSGSLGTNIQTTSLLNTPFFSNSFIVGETLKKIGNKKPFVGLGYLFLNSLPLITTKEKIKKINGNVTSDLDYLYATFTKFSSIHQLPYAWVLKYGSIWHRYKNFVDNGVDILDNIWVDFDFKYNFDPDFQNQQKQYQYTNFSNQVVNVSQQTTTVATIPNTTTTYNADQINLGFYPRLMNSFYYVMTNNDLFTGYSINDVFNGLNNKKVKVGINNGASFQLPLSSDTNNLQRTINVNNYFQFVDGENNTDFPSGYGGYLLMPSLGGIPLNQTKFECVNSNNKLTEELFDNNGMYNGSVRLLWGASHFGYFKNNGGVAPKRPLVDEYLKIINPQVSEQLSFNLANPQSTYSKIDEIFSIFSPEVLDKFEKLFLDFCDPNIPTSSLTLKGEINQPAGTIKNIKEKSLIKQLLNIFTVDKTIDTSTEELASKNLAESQLNGINGKVKEFLDFECLLKIGNPTNFNRYVFNNFSDNPDYLPSNKKTYDIYGNNLPPNVSFIQLQQQIVQQPDFGEAWDELLKRVGDSTISGISLSNSASTIFSFFIDNKIKFTKDNVIELSPLIKMYATQKNDNPNLTPILFKTSLTNLLNEQKILQKSMVNRTLQYLRNNLPNTSSKKTTRTAYSGNILKLNQYSAFKTFNDKWVAGSDFKDKVFFEDFLFQDRANSDIGDELTISTDEIYRYLKNQDNRTLMDFISTILSDNQCIFFALSSYINFYGIQDAIKKGIPIPPEIPNSLFGTYLNVDYIDSRPRFLITYVGKPSENLSTNDASFTRFGNDAFDLRSTTNPLSIPSKDVDFNKSNRVVGFNVDFGILNQNIFSDVQLDMSEKKNTAESFKIYEQLGASAAGDTVAQQTVSLYDIYRTRSYTCKVTSMGNAMIQPTMYFNLRYVPLFYGPYWITEVTHSIQPGNFVTDFTGIRMPLYSLPKPDSFTTSINRQFKENWKKITLKSRPPNVLSTTAYTNTNLSSLEVTPTQDCYEKVHPEYASIPFTSSTATTISLTDLETNTKTIATSKILGAYLYALASTPYFSNVSTVQSTYVTCQNYNLFSILTAKPWGGTLDSRIKSQVCANFNGVSRPIVAFLTFNESISFLDSFYSSFMPIIKKLYTLNTETDVLNDIAISGLTNCSLNCVEMKQLRMGVTLFQIKYYSWDRPFMFTGELEYDWDNPYNGSGNGKNANEIYSQFKIDRPKMNNPAYKSFVEIFTKASKNFLADNEVP
jgi:hypothetical protein